MFETEKYIAKIESGILRVDLREERTLNKTHFYPDGSVDLEWINSSNADKSEADLIRNMSRMPVFCATYQGGGDWDCDIDAGFQRWRGYKSGRAVGSALRQCGFDDSTINKIMRTTRKHVGAYCPRQW